MKSFKMILGSVSVAILTACGGGGGGSSAPTQSGPIAAPTPIAVKATSYENQMAVGASSTFPTLPVPSEVVGLVQEPGSVGMFSGRAAFADFFQDGAMSAVVFEPIYDPTVTYPDVTSTVQINPDHGANSPGRIYFIHKNPATGKWEDKTSALIKDAGSLHACITTSFIEVADINKDGRPDALIACNGTDFPWPASSDAGPAQAIIAYQLEKQYELLSQPDGTYKLVNIPVTSRPWVGNGQIYQGIYAHQSTLADIDGDGNLDILYVDPHGNETPFIMWGHGDGTFTQDMTRFPAEVAHQSIFTIRAIPINGVINVFVAGSDSSATTGGGYGTTQLQYIGGQFQVIRHLAMPVGPDSIYTFTQGLDFVYANNALYGYYIYGSSSARLYIDNAIVKFDLSTGQGTMVRSDNFTTHNQGGYGSGEITVHGTSIEGMTAGCAASSTDPADFNYVACHFVTAL